MENAGVRGRIAFVVLGIALMLFAIGMMFSPSSGIVDRGKVDLSGVDFGAKNLVSLNGDWEFYWNRLMTPEDFTSKHPPQPDSLMRVPGTWHDKHPGMKDFPHQGVATYRLLLKYPAALKDPAVHLQHVATAYKLWVNGRLAAEVGLVSAKPSGFQEGEQLVIVGLPKDKQEVELVFQVANLNYDGGGIMQTPVFGSKQVLERQEIIILAQQLFFIGGVFIFGLYYFLLFLLQTKNRTALLFSLFCFITVLRCLVWGAIPLTILFPNVSFDALLYINYFTGYNVMPIMLLFVFSIYPLDFNKVILRFILVANLFFEALLFTSPVFMSGFSRYLYLLILLQMIYLIVVMMKAVLRKRENGVLMFVAAVVWVLAVVQDILHYTGKGGLNLSYTFLYGNLAYIMAMSFVQASQQASTHKELLLYNEKLLEADRLKDKIMATEMSFLQAQIKPHFLYNALNAIANVCEKDGQKAGKLIVDLAIYLRRSLEFHTLDKKVTIEKELEYIDTYFSIEQARFGQKIQLEKEIEVPLDCQIPVLILQPLVENAVRHGISKKPGGGKVIVRMMKLKDGIGIEIEDDGLGIEGEKLGLLLEDERKEQGVGLLNIHHRLLRLYGRGLDISSEVGRGTWVRLVIAEGSKPL